MRIVGGRLGGRKFYPPADNWPTRPTTDYAKEAIFNILQNQFDFHDVRFLDLFGGTGSHCLEMVSRGCTDATYVDNFGGCVKFLKALLHELALESFVQVNRDDVFRFCNRYSGEPFHYIFAGPPYALPELPNIPDLIFARKLLKHDGLFILEHNHVNLFTSHPNFVELRKYGQCRFSLFRNQPN